MKLFPTDPTSDRSSWTRGWRLQKIIRRTLKNTYRLRQLGPHASPDRVAEVTRDWGQNLCQWVGMEQEVIGQPFLEEPCLFVANHISYLDIILLMSLVPITFVSKKEVAAWPIFGPGATAAGTVYLDRRSARSRSAVSLAISQAIMNEKKNVGLFPEGTSSMTPKAWRVGAFQIAAEHGFPVQPVRIAYQPLRTAAFIEEDSLMPHLWNLLGERKIEASVEFLPVERIRNPQADMKRMQALVQSSFEKKIPAPYTPDL